MSNTIFIANKAQQGLLSKVVGFRTFSSQAGQRKVFHKKVKIERPKIVFGHLGHT